MSETTIKYYTVAQFADLTGVSRRTIQRHIKAKMLKTELLRGENLIPFAQLDRYKNKLKSREITKTGRKLINLQ